MADHKTQDLPPIWQKPLDSAIHVRVYKNGDENFPGKLVTLNKRQQRTFDSWLKELSSSMKLRTGAVWRVFTPTHGHRVEDFDSLEDGNKVVVGGTERFKPLRYEQIDPNPKKSPPKTFELPEPNRRFQVSGKYKKIDTHAKIIKCWANGNDTTAPKTVLLPAHRNRPESLAAVLKEVSGVLSHECCGPVEKLYLPNGIKVMSLDQITPNGHFVALRKNDRFKPAHYKENSLPNLRCSPRLERKLPPLPRSNKTSSHSSPEHSITSHNGSEHGYTQRYRRDRERARREEDQVFHARPVKHKRSSEKVRPANYDHDNGGVFKAKSQNNATRGARQVEDSRHTRTELPVDRRPAEEVQDEEDGPSTPSDDWNDDPKSRERRERRSRKEDTSQPPPLEQEKQRTYRTNARQADSPGNEQARREAEQEARAKREEEDRARAEKARQQQEALRQKKKEKEEQEKRKKEEEERKREEEEFARQREEEEKKRREEEERRWREEEEERRRREEEEERRRREEEEDERRREEEERRRREEEEERNRAAAARTSTPNRDDGQATRDSPALDGRSGSDIIQEEQRRQAAQEETAAVKIQAGFRGYQARQDMKQKQAERSSGRDSSLLRDDPIPIQGEDDWGAVQDREREEQEKAATKIQAGFRGAKARQEVKAMRANQEQGQEQTPPPTTARDPASPAPPAENATEDLSQTEAEHAAATKIQAAFRGQQVRKDMADKKEAAGGNDTEAL